MKRCSTLLILREKQVKTILRYLYTLSQWLKSKSDNKEYWWGWRESGLLIHCWGVCKMVQPFSKNSLVVSYITKHATAIWSSNWTLGHLSQRNANYVHTESYTQMLTAALFIPVKDWKQPDAFQWVNGYTNCDIPIPLNTTLSNKKELKKYTQQLGWISTELCWVKKPIPKDHILSDFIYITFFEMTKL